MFVEYSPDELHAEAEYDRCYAESRSIDDEEPTSSEPSEESNEPSDHPLEPEDSEDSDF
jgi:hypothetical protein